MMSQMQQQEKLCLLLVEAEAEVETVLRPQAHTAPCNSDQHRRPSRRPLRHWQENGLPANELGPARKWQNEGSSEFLERSCRRCSNMEGMDTAIPAKTAPAT